MRHSGDLEREEERERKRGGREGKEEYVYRVSQNVNIKHVNAANKVRGN